MNSLLDKVFFLRREPEGEWPVWKKLAYYFWRFFILLCAGTCLGALALIFAYGRYSWGVFLGYLQSGFLLAMNILPAVVILFFLYGIFGRAWLAFLLDGAIVLGLSLGHYFKLIFRDDPLYFEDMLILREAGAMTGSDHYALFIDRRIALALICWALGTVLLVFLVRGKARGWKRRLGILLASVAVSAAVAPVYLDEGRYDGVQNYDYLNQWSATQNYISHGFFYPFLHSITEFVETPPEGYTQEEAEELLGAYADSHIPQDRKVNIISMMREAYVDFSQYGIEGLDCSGYELYHQLEEESYHGTLVTNIFAGGTVDTERCFLTGEYQVRNYRSNTNSYVWYLRNQGYTVEGSHPYYQWFYNRQNINGYLGFENYRFLEDDYENLTQAYLPEDSILLPEIYNDFEKGLETGKPYFSFNVNVQSHGPYSTTTYNGAVDYLTGDYTDGCKNAMNNYMAAIMNSDVELMKLVDQLRSQEEPVVLILFSDHLPWMGDSNIYYEEIGMDISGDTEESFLRHYSTEYLIWANDAAKEVLGCDFVGEGPTISPCYLMNIAFDLMGWEGPAFMQAMEEMRQVFPVVTTHGCYVVDGTFTDAIPTERQELFDQFLYLQYYWTNEFIC